MRARELLAQARVLAIAETWNRPLELVLEVLHFLQGRTHALGERFFFIVVGVLDLIFCALELFCSVRSTVASITRCTWDVSSRTATAASCCAW